MRVTELDEVIRELAGRSPKRIERAHGQRVALRAAAGGACAVGVARGDDSAAALRRRLHHACKVSEHARRRAR